MKKVGANFGFFDAGQSFTLDTFKQFADKFKRDYFGTADPSVSSYFLITLEIQSVPPESVEKEFWRCLLGKDNSVSVKYGADLISSKVCFDLFVIFIL